MVVFWRNSHTHAHPFNGPLSGTTRVSQYQKGKTNLDLTEVRDSEWQWHQLGHMQVCTSLQTDNHASTPPLSFYRPDALPAAQPTASKHCRRKMGEIFRHRTVPCCVVYDSCAQRYAHKYEPFSNSYIVRFRGVAQLRAGLRRRRAWVQIAAAKVYLFAKV